MAVAAFARKNEAMQSKYVRVSILKLLSKVECKMVQTGMDQMHI